MYKTRELKERVSLHGGAITFKLLTEESDNNGDKKIIEISDATQNVEVEQIDNTTARLIFWGTWEFMTFVEFCEKILLSKGFKVIKKMTLKERFLAWFGYKKYE